MRISGFSMGKNVVKLYYPIKEAIMSVLPIVDEFVFALGKGDDDDTTLEELSKINSPKLKIVYTEWDTVKYPHGAVNAQQTDIAKSHCTGDWLLYVQADEVVHERYLPLIYQRCEQLLHHEAVEGLLFDYKHFWGDYKHYHVSHGWYKQEIRIIRNRPDIHSWKDAQSFRKIPDFDGQDYYLQEGTFKLGVAKVAAEIYHYGWVRPPRLMNTKRKSMETIYKGAEAAEKQLQHEGPLFDYGNLGLLPIFKDTHPAVMEEFISRFNWADELQYTKGKPLNRPLHKHEKTKYQIITWLEQNVLGGREIGGFKNYTLIDV